MRIIHQPNSGKPAALSHALAEASSGIIVTIDADTAVEPNAISKLVRHFANPRVGAVAGNVKVGNRISWLTRWQALEYVTSQNLEKRAFDLLNCIPVVPGALSAWRAEAINDCGGFSADTVAEDTDLTITIRRAGWKIDYDEEAIGWTNAPETASTLIRQRFRWTFGTLQAFWKHRDTLGRHEIRHARLDRAAQHVPVPVAAAAVLAGDRPSVPRLAGAIRRCRSFISRTCRSSTRPRTCSARCVFFIGFMLIDFLTCVVAFTLERHEDWSLLWPLLLQRFYYRQMMYVRALPLGDGSRARPLRRLARRGARGSRAAGGAGEGLNSRLDFQRKKATHPTSLPARRQASSTRKAVSRYWISVTWGRLPGFNRHASQR